VLWPENARIARFGDIYSLNYSSKAVTVQEEGEVASKALNSEYKALAPANWQEVPDFTVANLYWYFKNRAS
jgi:hypothetical protein